jgi:hypothetical protein
VCVCVCFYIYTPCHFIYFMGIFWYIYNYEQMHGMNYNPIHNTLSLPSAQLLHLLAIDVHFVI